MDWMKTTGALLAILLLLGQVVNAQTSRTVQLTGYHHVPVVQTPAFGQLEVTLVGDTLVVEGQFRDLLGVFRSSGLYFGEPGERGNRLMPLKATLGEDRRHGHFLAEENRLVLRPSLLQALERGHLFFSIGSERRPHGEIRGQIPSMRPE